MKSQAKRPLGLSRLALSLAVGLTLAAALMQLARAQPSNSAPNQFGDRQTGHWGDPGKGHFGNPAAGDFDKSQLKVPPPGTRPLGKVQPGPAIEPSPYISLPVPAEQAAAAPTTKKPVKKRAVKNAKVEPVSKP